MTRTKDDGIKRSEQVRAPRIPIPLQDLVDRITDDNRHALIDFGPPAGEQIL